MINSGDTAFMIICAALVCLMTPGLAFFYGGLVSRKNVLTIMMQSFISMGIVTIIWFLFGFSLAFGPDTGAEIVGGLKYAFLAGVGMDPNAAYGGTIPFITFCAYQYMFAIITPALITGAFADRVSFKSYLIFLIGWSVLIYCPLTHWIWGGGFLQQLGVIDFAGGLVVHTSAGLAALASVIFVGKRKSSAEEKEPHNITHVALGTALLWFGWFGFNGGSALGANGVAAIAFVNTDIAASVAMATWLAISWVREGKPSFVGTLVGSVAGLATITPAAGFVNPWAAALIGLLAAVVCYLAVQLRIKLDWDDALDVWGVHGVGGILGSLAVGIFAASSVNGVGGLIEGNAHQLLVQIIAVVITAVYAFVVTLIILKVVNFFTPVRVSEIEEKEGLDISIHKEIAYHL